jgi:predicted transglutaminase-like cysteine proteinase
MVFLSLLGAANAAVEEAPQGSTPNAELQEPTVEPFGIATFEVAEGPLVAKWRNVRSEMQADMEIIARCRLGIEACPSPAAAEFLSIVERARARDGLARAGEVNRSINLDVRPADDMAQYGLDDFWSSPLTTLTAHAGDCEDYAIAKFMALSEAGITSQDLRLVILRNRLSQEDHAVVAVRVENRWRVLDNRGFLMLDDSQYTHFQPVFLIDEDGIRSYATPQSQATAANAEAIRSFF